MVSRSDIYIYNTKSPRARNEHIRKMTRPTIRSVQGEVSDLDGRMSEVELRVKRLEDAITKLQDQRSESEEPASGDPDPWKSRSERCWKDEFEHAKKHMIHLVGKPSTLLKGVEWKRFRKLEGIEWSTCHGWFLDESDYYYKRRFERLFDHPILLYISGDHNGVQWVYLVEDVTIQGVLDVIERHWSALNAASGGECEELDEEATKQLGREVWVETSDTLYLEYLECFDRGKWAVVFDNYIYNIRKRAGPRI